MGLAHEYPLKSLDENKTADAISNGDLQLISRDVIMQDGNDGNGPVLPWKNDAKSLLLIFFSQRDS